MLYIRLLTFESGNSAQPPRVLASSRPPVSSCCSYYTVRRGSLGTTSKTPSKFNLLGEGTLLFSLARDTLHDNSVLRCEARLLIKPYVAVAWRDVLYINMSSLHMPCVLREREEGLERATELART